MAERNGLLADRTDLRPADRDHLRALVADWTLLADLSFADLVLWVPTWNQTGFTAVGQVRPSTGPTVVPQDVVGQFVAKGRRPLLDRAYAAGSLISSDEQGGAVAIPVTLQGRVIAVIARHQALRHSARGELEEAYRTAAGDLVEMVIAGDFPLPEGLSVSDVPPRVGDGLMRLDRGGIVEFASPNASSAFHRLGLGADLVGSDLATTASRLSRTPGPADEALSLVASGTVPGATQIENAAAAVSLRAIPLREDGTRHGALVLVRDVTDLRQREQALLNKDSTIREIHHRVKNNLQTVAALLRMQARRLDEPTARAALDEAVRRVSSIAVVHETLSHQGTEDADFDEAADRVVSLTQDLAPSVTVSRVGSAGMLSAELISPLAMAVAELLSNAVEHSFAPGLAGLSDEPQVVLRLMRSGRRVTVEVADNGVGLDADFVPGTSGGLGVKIVNTLVTEVLKGTVNWEKLQPNGTKVVIDFLS